MLRTVWRLSETLVPVGMSLQPAAYMDSVTT